MIHPVLFCSCCYVVEYVQKRVTTDKSSANRMTFRSLLSPDFFDPIIIVEIWG